MYEIEERYLPDLLHKGSRQWVYWTVSRGIGLLVVVSGFYFFLPVVTNTIPYLTSFDSELNHLTATSIFASLILTFALIVVYRNMSEIQRSQSEEMSNQVYLQEKILEIQENQTEIMERQQRIMAADHKPNVQVNKWGCEGNCLYFHLSNVGNGIASDIGVSVYIEPRKSLIDFDDGFPDEKKYETFPQYVKRHSGSFDESLDRLIREDEKNIRFEGDIILPDILEYWERSASSAGTYQDFRAHLYQDFVSWWDMFSESEYAEYDSILLQIELVFEDSTGIESRIPSPVMQGRIEEKEDIDDFEDLLEALFQSSFRMSNPLLDDLEKQLPFSSEFESMEWS